MECLPAGLYVYMTFVVFGTVLVGILLGRRIERKFGR